jgi:hypothetical protein
MTFPLRGGEACPKLVGGSASHASDSASAMKPTVWQRTDPKLSVGMTIACSTRSRLKVSGGRRRDAPMSVGLNVCCAPTRELREQTAATLLSVEADALPVQRTGPQIEKSRFGLFVRSSVVPAFFVAVFSSEDKILRRSTRAEHWNIFPVHREYSIRPFAHKRLRH